MIESINGKENFGSLIMTGNNVSVTGKVIKETGNVSRVVLRSESTWSKSGPIFEDVCYEVGPDSTIALYWNPSRYADHGGDVILWLEAIDLRHSCDPHPYRTTVFVQRHFGQVNPTTLRPMEEG